MDGSAFDRFTRTLTTAGSRRRALGGMLAGTLGLLGAGAENAAAKKKKPCPPCKKRKKGKCKGTVPDGTACSGGVCQSGTCVVCPSGETRCGNACVNLVTDPAHCGRCGRTCPSGVCENGTCTCDGPVSILCPDGCFCTPRETGGFACSGSTDIRPCTSSTCPLGEVCRAGTNQCRSVC